MIEKFILIGVDGGATKISGWTVNINESDNSFSLGEVCVQKTYQQYPTYDQDFKPVDLPTQLMEMDTGDIQLTREELHQGMAYMEAGADTIIEISKQFQDPSILVGIGMPGLKSENKRGIVALANGPRMPRYTDIIERRLEMSGVNLVTPIAGLGSDADYCGIGEEYSVNGSFKKVENAYYLGGGTGTADALKLHGQLVPLDDTKTWLIKSWELKNDKGKSLERYASAGGIQSIYSEYSGISVEKLNREKIYPDEILQRAAGGEQAAVQTYKDVSKYLSQLFFERITTLYCGWQGLFSFVNPKRPDLINKHPFLGTLLERIIIGQRLGDLLRTPPSYDLIWNPLLTQLTNQIKNATGLDDRAKAHYIKAGQFNPDIIVTSKLREAPALGAGIQAYLAYTGQSI